MTFNPNSQLILIPKKSGGKNNKSDLEEKGSKPVELGLSDGQKPNTCGLRQYDDCSLKIKEWLNTEQAASYLGLSIGALRNMTSNGQIPYCKLGRRNRYRLVELRQLLLSQKRGGYYGY